MDLRSIYIALTDVWHMVLGFITAQTAKHSDYIGRLLFIYPWLGIIIPFVIIIIYMAYQSLDDDDPVERVGDLVEYSIGLIIGLVI
jgi:hypothetical protein